MIDFSQGDDEYLSGLRIVTGINALSIESLASLHLQNCQFVLCTNAIFADLNYCDFYLDNVLCSGGYNLFSGESGVFNLVAQNVTFDSSLLLDLGWSPYGTSVNLTNCLFYDGGGQLSALQSAIIGGGGTYSATSTSETTSNPFQTVGAASDYLADGSPFRSAGTTNIASSLLAGLRQRTTQAPIVYSNIAFTTPLVLSPQVARDTNSSPDLGYHYDAIDYALGGVLLSNDTSVLPGTVIATFGANAGFGFNVGSGVNFYCEGFATNWNRIVAYNTVQEQSISIWLTPSNGMVMDRQNNPGASALNINSRFTDWSVLAANTRHIDIGNESPLFLRDCQFHGGSVNLNYASGGGSDPSINNCLFERVNTILFISDSIVSYVQNNLFFGGIFDFTPESGTATVQNNLFDQTTIPDNSSSSGSYADGYNAFVTGSDRLQPTSIHDVILSAEPTYQPGPFGNYYLTTGTVLTNAGSTTADLLGLYDYTVITNLVSGKEIKETNSTVDIGYHYVATDSSGVPISTYTNGLADFLVTSSTNAIPDWWEFTYFGNLDQATNMDYDNDGSNNFAEFVNGTNPNKIVFSINLPNQYVTSSTVLASLAVNGIPSHIAILVDNTNFSSATWNTYTSSNISVSIGSTQGPHDIWVGLQGLEAGAPKVWDETTVVLDSTSPSITITNPATSASLNASRVNICGNFVSSSVQQVTVNGVLAFINGTNFEAVNVPLVGGNNTITALIQNIAGQTNTASITVVGATNLDGTLNDPVQLQATPVGGFSPLSVTFTAVNNAPGTLANVYYDFDGDNIADFTTNNTTSFSHTYTTNEYFPVVTIQTSSGRFSSVGGWNAAGSDSTNLPIRINVQASPVLVSTISITDPVDLKWTATSNLYVLSGSTATITEYDTNGTSIRSLSSIGSNPSGLDVDAAGNVYVAMTGTHQVWRYYPTNTTFAVDTSFGTNGCIGKTNGTSGTDNGQFNSPYDVAVSLDGDEIAVSDSGNNRIQQFDTNGIFLTAFGQFGTDIGQFNTPEGLAYDSDENLYIIDSGNDRIAISLAGVIVDASGTNGSGLLQFSGPRNISIGERGVFVADTSNNRIQSFALPAHGAHSLIPTDIRYGFSTNFTAPFAVAPVDNPTNELFYVADTGNNQVVLYKVAVDDPTPAWNSMTNNIAAGNLSVAISNFCSDSAEKYRQAFLYIGTNAAASEMSQTGVLTPAFISNTEAQCYFEMVIAGQTITFPIEFIKESGIWKIVEF